METIQMTTNRWMDEKYGVCVYIYEKEINYDTCSNVD